MCLMCLIIINKNRTQRLLRLLENRLSVDHTRSEKLRVMGVFVVDCVDRTMQIDDIM